MARRSTSKGRELAIVPAPQAPAERPRPATIVPASLRLCEVYMLEGAYHDPIVHGWAFGPPCVPEATRLELAAWVRAMVDADWPDPRMYIKALKIDCLVWEPGALRSLGRSTLSLLGGERRQIEYDGGLAPDERGLVLLHELAHAVLQMKGHDDHSETDATLLGAEIGAPSEVVRKLTLAELLDRQPHMPRWFLEGWRERAQRLAETRYDAATMAAA